MIVHEAEPAALVTPVQLWVQIGRAIGDDSDGAHSSETTYG